MKAIKCDCCGKFRSRKDVVGVMGEYDEEWVECRFCMSEADEEWYFKDKENKDKK